MVAVSRAEPVPPPVGAAHAKRLLGRETTIQFFIE